MNENEQFATTGAWVIMAASAVIRHPCQCAGGGFFVEE
jgi:hypothetical protein